MESAYDSEPLKDLYDKIKKGNGSIRLNKGPMAILHILPNIDGDLDLRVIANGSKRILALLIHDFNPEQIFLNRLIYYSKQLSYLDLLINGSIEIACSLNSFIFTDTINYGLFNAPSLERKYLIDYQFERHLWYCIKRNINFYREQGQNKIRKPIKIHLALLNIKNLELEHLNNQQYPNNDLILQPEIISEFENDSQTHIAIHNIADKIWKSFGGVQSIHFNENHIFIEQH